MPITLRILVVMLPLVLWLFSLMPADGVAVAGNRVEGRDIFRQNCAACHVHGVAQAPRVDLPAEWRSRLADGRQSLMESVLRGRGGMPPKGGNASITDAQAAAALDYIIEQVREAERQALVDVRP